MPIPAHRGVRPDRSLIIGQLAVTGAGMDSDGLCPYDLMLQQNITESYR
jgi:hypothetical protein